jgi:hypothetical protein
MRQCVFVVCVILALASTGLVAQCPANGLNLSFTGDRLGDPFSLTIYGTPGVSGLLGVDTSPGPVQTSIGTVCLGISSDLQLISFTLDGAGLFNMSGILPPSALLNGYTAYLQAVTFDASQPGGYGLSNNVTVKLRPPRLYFISPGYASPFGTVPGSWCGYDALSDFVYTTGIPLPSSVIDAVAVPQLGWIAFLLGDASIRCYSTSTAALTLTIPPLSPYPSKLCLDGTTLYVVFYGTAPSPFGGGTPGGVRAFSLPSGTPGINTTLPSGYNPDAMMILPGAGLAYLRTGVSITPIVLGSGAALTPIYLGGSSGAISDWTLQGNTLYVMMPGFGANPFGGSGTPVLLDAINTTTHTPLFGSPVGYGYTGAASFMRFGPGTIGGAVFFLDTGYALPLIQVNPSSLAYMGSLGVSQGITEMTLSPGGTEWLLLCNAGACGNPQLLRMVPPSMSQALVTPLAVPMELLISLPSATLRKGYTIYNNNLVLPFATDPATTPTFQVGLPISSASMRCVVD